ncbi:hypothetical protein CTAYLR_009492 [Chrysophaeum taylorii]|uniref:Carbohydrate kinase PfkB domain-containing protein n=1 Tax=Chrysophaeum taylorii TaxID=2483200 RepID=A0AAD7XP03_9STRA|nr:hypothetical protein CTAYLR_009492 [Chrysophaeum taylorii]
MGRRVVWLLGSLGRAFVTNSTCVWNASTKASLQAALGSEWPASRPRPLAIRTDSELFWRHAFDAQASSVRVVGAGLASTGSETIHDLVCEAGLGSIHMTKHCRVTQSAWLAHEKLLNVYLEQIVSCATPTIGVSCDAVEIAKRLRPLLRDVLVSGVVAIGDAPYSYLVDELAMALPGATFVRTNREPLEWALVKQKRFKGRDVICKPSNLEAKQAPTYLDLMGCLPSLATEFSPSIAKFFVNYQDFFTPSGHKLAAVFAIHFEYLSAVLRGRDLLDAQQHGRPPHCLL